MSSEQEVFTVSVRNMLLLPVHISEITDIKWFTEKDT